MAAQKTKRSKMPDTRPARARYWARGKLAKRKIRNLMLYNGFDSKAEASVFWRSVRTRHQ